MKYTFVFVCQRGPLEVQSMLLAASLAQNLRCDHRLVAALPEPAETWGRPREETLRFLERLGVARVAIRNRVSCELPVTNKLSCLDVEHDGDVTVYIDADMLCLKPFSGAADFEGAFGARAAGFDCFAENGRSDETWTGLYGHFGLPLPQARVTATATKEPMPPYFNGGLVVTRRPRELAETWLRTCTGLLEAMPGIEKRFYYDQVSLALAVGALGLEYRCLEAAYNFPCFVALVDPRDPPHFAHYHSVEFLVRDPALHAFCRRLVAGHQDLARILRRDRYWRALCMPRWPARLYGKIARSLLRGRWTGRTHAMTVGPVRDA